MEIIFLIAGDWRPRFHPWPCSSGDSIPPCFNQFLGASRVSPGCQYGFTTFHLPVVVVGPDACIYMSRDPHTPPLPQPDGPPPPCGRGGGVFSAAKPIYAKYIAQGKECASNVQGTAWAALVSIHRNHVYVVFIVHYSAYVSIIRMDILYVI